MDKPFPPALTDLTYTPFFCEENIWLLGKSLLKAGFHIHHMQVLLLSNPQQSIPLLQQKSATAANQAVIWDYHVILELHADNNDWIYDFDSRLPFPSNKQSYFQQTLINKDKLQKNYRVYCRRIPLSGYLNNFNSDRKHMLNQNGQPRVKMPDYPPILTESTLATPLHLYWDMEKEVEGTTVDLL